MKCKLCLDKEATKKNTHYLTDAIIRTNLNEEGSNSREKGAYFDMSNTNAFTNFNFQRSTSLEKIKEVLGREPTDEEIEAAKDIPFSVDDTFCPSCENIFTDIESQFIKVVFPQISTEIVEGKAHISISESSILRKFFLLQVWRSAICTSTFEINANSLEELRLMIFQGKVDKLHSFPISITYLETTGAPDAPTQNLVGLSSDRNPNLIFMNHFVIQFYDAPDEIRLLEFYGLNNESDYKDYINIDEDEFIIKVMRNDDRIKYHLEMLMAEKLRPMIENYKGNFRRIWEMLMGSQPKESVVEKFIQFIIKGDETSILKYSKEQIINKAAEFMYHQSRYYR